MEGVLQKDYSQIVTDSISWPFESKENFFSCIIPVITVIATQKMSETKFIFSLFMAAGSFAWVRLYLNNQSSNKVKEKKSFDDNLAQQHQLLGSYLPLGFAEMQKVFLGYELDEKKERVNVEYYSKKNTSFLEVCKAFKLNPEAVENVWKSFRGTGVESTESRFRMLSDLMPEEMKKQMNSKSE